MNNLTNCHYSKAFYLKTSKILTINKVKLKNDLINQLNIILDNNIYNFTRIQTIPQNSLTN